MNPQRGIFLIQNLVGGLAVLGSYAWGVTSRPDAGPVLWGGVPDALRPLYSVNMLLAAAGYFAFSPWFLRASGEPERRFLGGYGFALINAFYALVLFPSALWLPLTFAWADAPSPALWWTIRLDLFAVGAGSVGLLAALWSARPRGGRLAFALAVAGLVPFCLQTALLDALVWPWFYPR